MAYASKAEQKRELEQLNRQYHKINEAMQTKQLEARRDNGDPALMELYWERPHDLHQFTAKKRDMFRPYFPDEVAEIEALLELREAVKASEIRKVEANPQRKLEDRITADLKALMERQERQYVTGLEMTRYFGTMPVSVNAHFVVNQYGTTFVRCFYYLHGKLTALNTIMAIKDTYKREIEGD